MNNVVRLRDDVRPDAEAPASSEPRAANQDKRGDRSGAGRRISFRGVSKSFGPRVVLKELDLDIAPGQFVAIVGRSGGGKSTLLRLIAGLAVPDAGVVALDGARVAGLQASSRLMFQDARLLPWQRVIGNVGIARGENWREEAMDALASVGLADRARDWPRVLSGGQRQRVALARALVSRPKVLLLDEPFGALDALTRLEMHQLLERLWRERGFTIVLITHDVAEAVALADRVLVLREGAIRLDAPVPQARPRHETRDPRSAALQAQILAEV